MSERLKVKVGKYTFHLAPLSYLQKAEVNSHVKVHGDNVSRDMELSAYTVFKHSLKAIDGHIQNSDGSDYELEFTDNDKTSLTDECLSEILNIKWPADILFIANSMIESIPDKITNPMTGEEVEGIQIVLPTKKTSKKKK